MATRTYTVGAGQDYTDLDDFHGGPWGTDHPTNAAALDDDIILHMKELSSVSATWTDGTKTGGTITITVDSGDEHDGTSGTGYGFDMGTTTTAFTFNVESSSEFPIYIDGLEVDMSGGGSGINQDRGTIASKHLIARCLFHSFNGPGDKEAINIDAATIGNNEAVWVARCIFYDFTYTGTAGEVNAIQSQDGGFVFSCSCHDMTGTTSSNQYGWIDHTEPDRKILNCAIGDVTNSGSGSDFEIDGGADGVMSCATVGAGLNGRGVVTSTTAAAMFNSPGTGDLTPKAAGPLVDAGYKIPEVALDVYTDAVGRDVLSQGDTLDIGAIERV